MKLKSSNIIFVLLLTISASAYAAKGGGSCDSAPYCEGPADKLNGEEICRDSKKVMRRKITLKNGKKNGAWECFDEKGKLLESRQYKADLLDGLTKRYIDSLDQFEEVNYKNDVMDGIHKGYYTKSSNGKEVATEYFHSYYLNGSRHGWFILYDLSGKEIKRECYQNDNLERKNPEKCGGVKAAETDDKKASSGKIELLEKKDSNGKLVFQESRLNGRLEGLSKYYKKGTLYRETNYKDNKKMGLEKLYFDSGVIKSKRVLTDDYNFDQYVEYFENQQTKIQVTQLKKADSMKGSFLYKYQTYSDYGKKLMDGECTVGALEEFNGSYCYSFSGLQFSYNKENELVSTETYTNGNLDGKSVYIEPAQIVEATYKKGLLVKKDYLDIKSNNLIRTEEFLSDGSIKK